MKALSASTLALLLVTVILLRLLGTIPAPTGGVLAGVELGAVSATTVTTVTVDGQANIFGAGHATAPDPGGGGGGLLPPSVSFSGESGQVVFRAFLLERCRWWDRVLQRH